jgi:dTDP-4-dehydrorhamnose reductase
VALGEDLRRHEAVRAAPVGEMLSRDGALMRLLVTGAAGMLGHDVLRAGARSGHELVAYDLPEIDITDPAAVNELLNRLLGEPGSLHAVLNCAAWTDVDGAESHREQAHAVNADGAGNLARAAARVGLPLLHISTDYVFDGVAPLDASGRPRPYYESDPTGPRSVYGQTKLDGERQVLAASPRHAVVRTAWLYGLHGPNFVETMLRLAGERDAVQVVTDQVGSPTWSGHLAPAALGLLEREVSGLVHLTGTGEVSWNGFTQEIFRQAEVRCRVEPATSEQMARPAPRPAWSALASERDDVLPMPPWQDGLAGYLAARAGMMRA